MAWGKRVGKQGGTSHAGLEEARWDACDNPPRLPDRRGLQRYVPQIKCVFILMFGFIMKSGNEGDAADAGLGMLLACLEFQSRGSNVLGYYR